MQIEELTNTKRTLLDLDFELLAIAYGEAVFGDADEMDTVPNRYGAWWLCGLTSDRLC